MKQLKRTLLIIALFIGFQSQAQKDWSKVDFTKDYKGKSKIGGGMAKSLKNDKTFVSSYAIGQAIVMKGSETSGALQSGSRKTVFSEASLDGISREEYQQMSDELYQELIAELKNAGLNITTGEDVIASAFAKKQLAKDDAKIQIGSTGNAPSFDGKRKVDEGSMPGYPVGQVLRDLTFPPRDVNTYQTKKRIYGTFYQNLGVKEGFNLLHIKFFVSFASFEGGKGYKSVNLNTAPQLAVKVQLWMMGPKGSADIWYEKDIYGNNDWLVEMGKTKDNQGDAEFFGLARSADYSITANSSAYLSEVKSIISNLQKDIVKHIKVSF